MKNVREKYVCVCVCVCVCACVKHVLAEEPYVPGTLCFTINKVSPTIFFIFCATNTILYLSLELDVGYGPGKNINEYHISYFFRHFKKFQ